MARPCVCAALAAATAVSLLALLVVIVGLPVVAATSARGETSLLLPPDTAAVETDDASLKVEVFLSDNPTVANLTFAAEEGTFGLTIAKGQSVSGYLMSTIPTNGCGPISPSVTNMTGLMPWFALMRRGDCLFFDKALNAQSAGASYALVYNNEPNGRLAIMTTTTGGTVSIGTGFMSLEDFEAVEKLLVATGWVYVRITKQADAENLTPWGAILFVALLAFLISSCFILLFLGIDYARRRRHGTFISPPRVAIQPLSEEAIKAIPEVEITEEELMQRDGGMTTCAICLDDFAAGDRVKRLPCRHEFHVTCITPWFERQQRVCPTCKSGTGLHAATMRCVQP